MAWPQENTHGLVDRKLLERELSALMLGQQPESIGVELDRYDGGVKRFDEPFRFIRSLSFLLKCRVVFGV